MTWTPGDVVVHQEVWRGRVRDRWRPDPSWATPRLPPGWEAVPG